MFTPLWKLSTAPCFILENKAIISLYRKDALTVPMTNTFNQDLSVVDLMTNHSDGKCIKLLMYNALHSYWE